MQLNDSDARIVALVKQRGYCFVSEDNYVFAIETDAQLHYTTHGKTYGRFPQSDDLQTQINRLLSDIKELKEDRDTTERIFSSLQKNGFLV